MSPEGKVVGLMRNSRPDHTAELFRQYYPQFRLAQVHEVADLQGIDFLLAGGGKDIDPTLYGERNRSCKALDPEADQADLAVLQLALQAGIPFLGLCRGAQLLNVALGGTLYQDLQKDTENQHAQTHALTYAPSVQARFAGLDEVNSTHHQGVDRIGDHLAVLATAGDGLPEMWWQPGSIGVQFHPESLIQDDSRWTALFDWWLSGAAQL